MSVQNHWQNHLDESRRFLASRLGASIPPPRPANCWRPGWRTRERIVRQVARMFRVPRRLVYPRVPVPFKSNAKRYGR